MERCDFMHEWRELWAGRWYTDLLPQQIHASTEKVSAREEGKG